MPTVRPANPLYLPPQASTFVDGANNNVLSMSRDHTTLYGGQGPNGSTQTALKSSTDDGVTWTTIHTFSGPVVGVHVMDNGEALVAVGNATGSLWKSTGFAASPTTATWTQVLASSGLNAYFRGEWTLHPWTSSGSLVVVNEYGAHVGDGPVAATKVWLSTDYGSTFTVIFDLALQQPGTTTIHTHASAYDKVWDRIWITYGDGTTASTPNPHSGIAYSDDRGATWTIVPGTDLPSSTWQATSIAILPDCILFGSDGQPAGVHRIRRDGYRVMSAITEAHLVHGGTGSVVLAFQFWQDIFTPGMPLLMSFNHGGSNPGGISWTCVLMTYDGKNFTELLTDRATVLSGSGFTNAVGPTASGKVVGAIKDARQANVSKVTATLLPEVLPSTHTLIGGTAAFNGTGAQTTFTIPHGLGVAPARKSVEAESATAAAPFYVTVDATNLTVTFTTAPATGTGNVVLGWTAGI